MHLDERKEEIKKSKIKMYTLETLNRSKENCLPVFDFLLALTSCPFCSSAASSSSQLYFLFLSFFFFFPSCSCSGSCVTVFSEAFVAFPLFCWRASLRSRLFSFFLMAGLPFCSSIPFGSALTSGSDGLVSIVSCGTFTGCWIVEEKRGQFGYWQH